jgi:hypothetical protein
MRKVITFLGTSPRETTYSYKGGTYRGRAFGEALCQFLDFDQMLVFVTEEASTLPGPFWNGCATRVFAECRSPWGKMKATSGTSSIGSPTWWIQTTTSC